MLINFLKASVSPPPNAFRIRCELTFSSSNDQEPLLLFRFLSLPSTVGAPDVVGTSSGRAVLETTPLRPLKCPPTRATTSSELSLSHSPSVARTTKRVAGDRDGLATLPKSKLRWVTTGVAVTYGGVLNDEGGGRIG